MQSAEGDTRLARAVLALHSKDASLFPGDLFSFVFAKLNDEEALRAAVEDAGDALFNKKQRSLLRTALKGLRTETERSCKLHPSLDSDCMALVEQLVASRRAAAEYEAARVALEAELGVPLMVVGSVATGLHLPGSDLDLCLPEGASLEEAARRVRTACVEARVPVLKATRCRVECDLSAASGGSVRKAAALVQLVERNRGARELALLVKQWSRLRGLSNSAAFGVNSYAWAVAVVAFLEGREKSAEQQPLGRLLVECFGWLRAIDWKSQCVSVGGLRPKPPEMVRSGTPLAMCVQDPVFAGENCTRTVTEESLQSLLAEFVRAECMLRGAAPLAEVLAAPESKRAVLNAKWLKLYVEPQSASAAAAAAASLQQQPRLKTVEFLQTRGLDALVSKYSLVAKRHAAFPNLVQLSYQLSVSPMASPIVAECRGLIVDEQRDWAVVSYPFGKFFNWGEPKCARIDWASAQVYPKLDGSIMTMYRHGGVWHVASQRRPDGAGSFDDGRQEGAAVSLADTFWKVFGDRSLPQCNGRFCYMFEMCLKAHPVIVEHTKDSVTLIGLRSLETLQEVRIEDAGDLVPRDWPRIAALQVAEPASARLVTEMARALSSLAAEGFVVVDGAFQRAKFKAPTYVQVALLKCEPKALPAVVSRRLLALTLAGETDEMALYFPQHAKELERLKKLVRRLQETYAEDKQLVQRFRSSKCATFGEFLTSLPIREVEALLHL